ncbi:MAG: putative zinc-binding peptidase [Planctomycetaceae bacterium]|nr:putative zinc-binding peptidase [Planctomycetaceae bacterium]
MKIFHCGHCDQLVFFENTTCVNCGHVLAYLPDQENLGTLEPDGEDRWPSLSTAEGIEARAYRLCKNARDEDVCNWAVPVDDPNPYCLSCRLTRIIPDLSRPGDRAAWARLEASKRRLIYSLLRLDLPLANKMEDPLGGLAFEFLADPDPGTPGAVPVLTGHDGGVITINVAEADDAERERRRHQMHEPYRTILGHFRHEIGHYYWDRLIKDSEWIDAFRGLFGDEREDYDQAIKRHHEQGAPADWPASFVSAYASSHPWEDWAESWAHYLHIVDNLETAVECGLSLRPRRKGEPAMKPDIALDGQRTTSFDQIISRWFPLTYVLNNLNRGMGLPDAYPFVLSTPALDKLRFIHEVVGAAASRVPTGEASELARPAKG